MGAAGIDDGGFQFFKKVFKISEFDWFIFYLKIPIRQFDWLGFKTLFFPKKNQNGCGPAVRGFFGLQSHMECRQPLLQTSARHNQKK